MEYKIVTLEEKTVIGLCCRTNNHSPQMGQVITNLWQHFYSADIYPNITHRKNDKALGIYTDYASDDMGDYTVMVGCEIAKDGENQMKAGEMVIRHIPAGKYALFVVRGHMVQAVAEFWQKLWQMDLNRAFLYDFEEYQNASVEAAEIHIYIRLKDE